MFYRPRFLHWIYAALMGYFWLPCSICDKNFGGHETAAFLDSDYFNGFGVCPCCVEEAHRRNKQLMNELENTASGRIAILAEIACTIVRVCSSTSTAYTTYNSSFSRKQEA